jgi:hypothetical protein
MADWVAISSLATAGGTLALAGATFAAVRSSNRSSRVAERTLLAELRPVLMPSRLQDPVQKIHFADGKWLATPGGGASVEASDEAVWLTISLRNAGTGLAVLHGWLLYPERIVSRSTDSAPPLEDFRRLTRDLYVPVADIGFWQGAFRDPTESLFAQTRERIEAGEPLTVDVLYGDHEGGQRVVTRFLLSTREDGVWMASAGRHWNIDREDPR